jgi:hypothetical protein
MNCLETSKRLETFHDGELIGREMREVALHVAQCAACEALLAEWEKLHGLLHEAWEPTPGALAAIWEGVESEIEAPEDADNGWGGFRIAAATTPLRILRGGSSVAEQPAVEEGDEIWLRPEQVAARRPGTAWRAGMALAASLFLAVFLLGDEDAGLSESARTKPTTTVASRPQSPAQSAAVQPVSLEPVRAGKSGPPRAIVNREVGGFTTASAQHVQIHSVKQSHGEMAMWAEPTGNTAVIWVGEADPQARR